MGIGVSGYISNKMDACCSRGTFSVFLDTIESVIETIRADVISNREYDDFYNKLKETFRCDVVSKLNTYTETSVYWYNVELRALEDFLDYIRGDYIDELKKEYEDDPNEYEFHLCYFLRFLYTVKSSEFLIISL